MLLIFLSLALSIYALVALQKEKNILKSLQVTTGTLLGYLKDEKTGYYNAILSFSYKAEKYFFKNTNSTQYPEYAIGSTHNVYYETPEETKTFEIPIQATLGYKREKDYRPLIFLGLGFLCILLFSELTQIYFATVLYILGLYLYFRRPGSNSHLLVGQIDTDTRYLKDYPVSQSFSESEFEKLILVERSSLKNSRSLWYAQIKEKAYLPLGIALICFIFINYSAFNQEPAPLKSATPEKKVTINDVLDAGSIEGASDEYADIKEFAKKYCFSFQSSSCLFSYEVLDDSETEKLYERFFSFLLLDIALISLGFSLVAFKASYVFARFDQYPETKKPDSDDPNTSPETSST
ncbi:MAG: hypothetical protein R3A80_09755 [Bdellovibrionota bacterium]